MVRKNMKAVADRVTTIVNDANAEVVFVTGEIPFTDRSDRGPARARLRVSLTEPGRVLASVPCLEKGTRRCGSAYWVRPVSYRWR
jgi:hypothetical protein